jgi:hypothetical protein
MQQATSTQQELDTWKDTCDRLTASVSRKESEIQTLSDRLLDMEDLVRNGIILWCQVLSCTWNIKIISHSVAPFTIYRIMYEYNFVEHALFIVNVSYDNNIFDETCSCCLFVTFFSGVLKWITVNFQHFRFFCVRVISLWAFIQV